MSCSADLISSRVTPCVDLRVDRTILAWAFLWVSLSSSRLGGTNDLDECTRLHIRSHSAPTAQRDARANHHTDLGLLSIITFNTPSLFFHNYCYITEMHYFKFLKKKYYIQKRREGGKKNCTHSLLKKKIKKENKISLRQLLMTFLICN